MDNISNSEGRIAAMSWGNSCGMTKIEMKIYGPIVGFGYIDKSKTEIHMLVIGRSKAKWRRVFYLLGL